jgi:hypothetical protein
MAQQVGRQSHTKHKKKTKQGMSNNTKTCNGGGGPNGSTKSKHYKKRYKGEGKRR